MRRAPGRTGIARLIRTIDAHAGGGPVRMIVDGLPQVTGRSMGERQVSLTRRDRHLRQALLGEPRGARHLTGALLTEPETEGAHAGVLFLRASGCPPFSGHAIIAVATIAVERHLTTTDPSKWDRLSLDTVAGNVIARPTIQLRAPGPEGDGALRVSMVAYEGPPASVVAAGLPVVVRGRALRADLVASSGLLALVDGEAAGVPLHLEATPELQRAAAEAMSAMAGAVRRVAPEAAVDAIVFTSPADAPDADLRSVTVRADGAVERSPSGRGTAAVMAVLDAMGLVPDERRLVHEGPAGLRFEARVLRRFDLQGRPAIVPEISGSAWITGEHTFVIDPDDPLTS